MRAYRLLLRLFPASFRAEYGGEMASVFARRRRDVRGPLAVAALWAETVADVAWSALRVHQDLLAQDLRYTARNFRRAPGFTLTVVLVSALGVGATTAAFSITDHVLLRPLPFKEGNRLVKLWQHQVGRGYTRVELSPANFRDWKRLSTSFESMAAFTFRSVNLVGDGDPERLEGAQVTAELFPLLGVEPLRGRVFSEADDLPGAPATVILSHGLWQGRFGADASILGRTVSLDGAAHAVIGVMPRSFHFPRREVQLWTATRFAESDFEDRGNLYLQCIGRLRPGVSLEQARAEMRVVAAGLEREYPDANARTSANLLRLRDEVASQARLLLWVLLGAAFCVLLIACTNLASLLLARALERRAELAVRTALGAGRERLVRQLLTESVALAVAGGALGVLLAVAATPLLIRLVPNALPVTEAPPLDLRVLLFALVLTAVTGVAFGLVPAWRAFGQAEAMGLREGARAGTGRQKERLRSGLVMAEVAVSVVLLVSSGLLIRALFRLQAVDPGFHSEGILTLRTSLPLPKYEPTETRAQFYTNVLSDVRGLPGVKAAAYVSSAPLVMRGGMWIVTVPGQPEAPGEASMASLRFVTPDYFATLGIPILAGRDVAESDTATSLQAAVVSESFAKRYWPGQDALGRRFRFGGGPTFDPFQERTVVGVVGDVKFRGLERTSEPQLYLPYRQVPDGALIGYAPKDLLVKASTDPLLLVPSLRRIVARADPEQPISDLRTLRAIVEEETAARRVQVRVLGGFAGLALLLAALGIHGLLAFTVSSRSREIGVRMALGAKSREVLGLVLSHGLRLAAVGAALGLALSYAAGRALEALLAGVSPRDPATFLAAMGVAVVMTLAGSLLPALRALRVDPLVVMRTE